MLLQYFMNVPLRLGTRALHSMHPDDITKVPEFLKFFGTIFCRVVERNITEILHRLHNIENLLSALYRYSQWNNSNSLSKLRLSRMYRLATVHCQLASAVTNTSVHCCNWISKLRRNICYMKKILSSSKKKLSMHQRSWRKLTSLVWNTTSDIYTHSQLLYGWLLWN